MAGFVAVFKRSAPYCFCGSLNRIALRIPPLLIHVLRLRKLLIKEPQIAYGCKYILNTINKKIYYGT